MKPLLLPTALALLSDAALVQADEAIANLREVPTFRGWLDDEYR